jgi:hypothetical protein
MKRLFVVLTLFVCLTARGQDGPRISNGKVETASASAGLEKTVRGLVSKGGAMWIAYAVPTQTQVRHICCFESFDKMKLNGECSGGCRLEGSRGTSFFSSRGGGSCAKEEPADDVFIFLRAEGGKIVKVRPFSVDCSLDAGNMTVHWLDDVKDAESVALLTSLARESDLASLRSDNGPLDAIALHKDASADAALEGFMSPQTPEKLREHAAFWMGQERGHHGFEVLRKFIRSDGDENFRKHLTFALSQSDDKEALQELIRAAHEDKSGEVRGQALFWLAQKAGHKVAGEISDAIENDPDTDVKKKAVFALSQMDANEGVPKLIEVARTNRNRVVRKEAIFWLGQSEDPRALAYIEQILLK